MNHIIDYPRVSSEINWVIWPSAALTIVVLLMALGTFGAQPLGVFFITSCIIGILMSIKSYLAYRIRSRIYESLSDAYSNDDSGYVRRMLRLSFGVNITSIIVVLCAVLLHINKNGWVINKYAVVYILMIFCCGYDWYVYKLVRDYDMDISEEESA